MAVSLVVSNLIVYLWIIHDILHHTWMTPLALMLLRILVLKEQEIVPVHLWCIKWPYVWHTWHWCGLLKFIALWCTQTSREYIIMCSRIKIKALVDAAKHFRMLGKSVELIIRYRAFFRAHQWVLLFLLFAGTIRATTARTPCKLFKLEYLLCLGRALHLGVVYLL